ncbi:MAG: hypothetical protein GXP55_01485 [Deltaproteobacteria bacterium]|nr:hypothetical protein [Deltaproteobacteria bacterium]
MTDAAQRLLDEALTLSGQERRWLAQRLIEAVPAGDDEVRHAWNLLAAQRLERAAGGGAKLISHEDVLAHARELLADR